MEEPKKDIGDIVSAEDILSEVARGFDNDNVRDRGYSAKELEDEAKYLCGLNPSEDHQ